MLNLFTDVNDVLPFLHENTIGPNYLKYPWSIKDLDSFVNDLINPLIIWTHHS